MKWLRVLGVMAVAAGVGLILWLVVGNDVANRRLVAVEKAWSEAPGSLDDFPNRHPARATNEVAQRLETVAEAMGVDLRPRFLSGAEDPKRSRPAAETSKVLSGYLDANLADPSAAALPPTGEAEAALARLAPGLAPIVGILSKETPVWLEEIGRGYEAPIPNLLGHIQLQRILLASSLRLEARGDARGAEKSLDASWTLNESLTSRPELISQLIAIAVGRMQAGVLRKVPVDPTRWVPRLAACEPRRGILEAFTGEAWVMRYAVLRGAMPGPDGGPRSRRVRALEFLSRPRLKIEVASALTVFRECFLDWENAPVSGGTAKARNGASGGGGPFGRVLSELMIPNFETTLLRADRLAVDLELTRKALELRAARRTGREWPPGVPGIEASVVKDARWIYARTPDGRATIELSRELEWGKTVGIVLPTRWVSPI